MAFGGTMQQFSEQNVVKLAAGTATAGITATDATWHAMQAVYSTTASAA